MDYFFLAYVSLLFASYAAADHHSFPKFCTDDVAKCNMSGINITCVAATNEGKSCVKDVADGKADLALALADDLVENEDKLKIVYGQKLKNVSENFVKYYGLAIVQKGSNISLLNLKGVKSCHTGAGRTVGWKIPIGYLLFTKEMDFTENQWKSASDFFGQSCVPGIKSKTRDGDVLDDLCSLCNSSSTCDGNDRYAGYEGAFKCMAEGNDDRVAFVKETTAYAVIDSDLKYGVYSGYRLLCPDGTRAAISDYKNCNIDYRPAAAVVTNMEVSNVTVDAYQKLLDSAVFANLVKSRLVSSSAESLQKYTGENVTTYVGRYGDHYKALAARDEPAGAAQSVIASFAVLFSAIFALLLLP